ncbi:MAG: hypothetical protein J7K65_09715, partial [Planctomycetes bacterium]|nr:hypothetical protein [Planctomycetota bacterium]
MGQNVQKLDVMVPAVGQSGYTITIGRGILCDLWQQIKTQWPTLNPFIVTDSELVKVGHLKTLVGGESVPTYVIEPAGEVSKHIQTVVAIVEEM